MAHQPTEAEKNRILAQILKSPGFQESKRHQELLQYLVEKSATAASLKETEIAQDVFGKDLSFDPATDPLIRSYISNLRKKLEHYYLTTADEFAYRIEIPKGHYLVKYLPAEPKPRSGAAPSVHSTRFLWAAIAVLSLIVIILGVREARRSPLFSSTARQASSSNPVWSEFVQPKGRPTLIVLGDFFFLKERDKKNDGYYRSIKINTLDEYLDSISRNPDFGRRYMKNNFSYLRPSAPWGVMEVLPLLQGGRNRVTLKLASQFTPDDFKSNNIVFIGSFKTMYLLKSFLGTFGLDYVSTPSSFRVRDSKMDSVYAFRPEKLSAGNLESDYGVIAKAPGPEGSSIILLLGFSESGVIQAAHAACDPGLLRAIGEKYSAGAAIDPSSFLCVIGAEGITQSLYDADIKYVSGLGAPARPHTPPSSGAVEGK